MEAGEENCSDVSLKRPRAPLSDSEDNSCSAPGLVKRRRLEAAGQENRCPEPSSSGRQAELETRPDTPIVPSVRSRVQQLTQRRDGGAPLAQRCLSDPGSDSRGFREPLLGEAEFNQRMERFREPSFQSSPTQTLTPANPCPRTRSNFVSVIQQKLQGSTTPSSKQVSRIRQEREHELSQLPFQPITENAWLKRSSSDSSLAEDHDSGIAACSVEKNKMETETEKEKSEEGEAKEGERDESDKLESIGDELLTFPPSGILSPLSKSVEAVVTPLNKPPTIQSVTPGVQRQAQQTSKPQPSVSIKEKITALNEEAGKLQTVINQTLQALSCCTDEEHGRGSLEEAEAEKLLLVSCEKRSALLAEVTRLKEERSSESGEAAGENSGCVSQQPCRGTVSITNIQLPLKVEYVCSSHNRAGRPSHYFFVLIRYGPYNIVATPLATAADAQNGDTISFPTSALKQGIFMFSFSGVFAPSAAAPPLSSRRSSNFSLVGSHKITLASLGHSKFPLDKMKLDGKVKRLLGDEFQEKVPFLSPLEGNIYLQLESKSHSDVQHQGFLTMFELVSGYGVWHRRFFVLEGCSLQYWNYPNDRETKEAEGSVSLASPPSQYVRPVERASCARPFTFELVSSTSQQEDDLSQEAVARCLFSADSKQERLDWMQKLNQALLDFHTWSRTQTESQQSNTSSSGNLRESIL
uniref:Anillin, actin binding protein 2 n=1 Tax=Amphilophus citrinellus TaxID=61819 RepID=A0A3Q0S0I3_AMPCI